MKELINNYKETRLSLRNAIHSDGGKSYVENLLDKCFKQEQALMAKGMAFNEINAIGSANAH